MSIYTDYVLTARVERAMAENSSPSIGHGRIQQRMVLLAWGMVRCSGSKAAPMKQTMETDDAEVY